MIKEELIREVAEAYKNPEKGDADRNGNTRLTVLQKQFHLSSLKVQKILVTAGVYEPVKGATAYHMIMKMRESGASQADITKRTGYSKATVSACFPYERTIYNADLNGADITDAAVRKRTQRSHEKMKRLNAIDILRSNPTDVTFWLAVQEHEGETFIGTDGVKFRIETSFKSAENEIDVHRFEPCLYIYPEKGDVHVLPKEDVLAVFHNALELKADGQDTEAADFDQVPALQYVFPLLVFFGIIPGNRRESTIRRNIYEYETCSCCGRRAEYRVRTYADLVRIAEELEEEERSKWDPEELKRVRMMEASMGRISWRNKAAKVNASILSFDQEGERQLCRLCATTIRMALEDGELPHSSAPRDLKNLTPDAAKAAFEREFKLLPEDVQYEDRLGREYPGFLYDEEEDCKVYLRTEKDFEGIEHVFACLLHELPSYLVFDAIELHRLTKTGRISRYRYTGTDYEFNTGVRTAYEDDEEEYSRKIRIGFLKLADKIRDALRNPSLEWHEGSPYLRNAVTIGNRQCTLRSIGEMKVVYVDEWSVQGRKWHGGQYGYMIDGIIFTGEEVALMSSVHEGWTLQFRFADPADQTLRAGDHLMPVQLGEKELVSETTDLLNLFSKDGRFISSHDQKNFSILFEKTVMKKLKLYYESHPRGFGQMAGMKVIGRLDCIRGTEEQVRQVRALIQM